MAKYTIPVLKKAIAVLKEVSESHGYRTAKALSHSLVVPQSTTYRILQTFLEEDWVRPAPGGQFMLSFGLLPLLQPLLQYESLIETVREHLLKLSRDTGLATKISVRQGDQAVTIFRIESSHPTSVSAKVGASFNLVQGSSGAILLTGLSKPEVETIIDESPEESWRYQSKADLYRKLREFTKKGFCTDLGKSNPSMFAISAPLIGVDGQVLAAVTILGFPRDFEKARSVDLGKQLLFTVSGCNQLIQRAPKVVFK